MQGFRSWWVFVLMCSAALIVASCGDSSSGSSDTTTDVIGGTDIAGDDDTAEVGGPLRLHAEGTALVDSEGNPVVLRGVNLGAWLYGETWISQIDYRREGRLWVEATRAGHGADAEAVVNEIGYGGDGWETEFRAKLVERIGESDTAAIFAAADECLEFRQDDGDSLIYRGLEQRFGVDRRDELLDAFFRAWITEADIQWLGAQGFSVVRVPIGYRVLLTGSHLEDPTALNWNEATLERIDNLLDWCEAAGIYAVLDIQESPGGHNDYSGPARLYGDPAMQALTVGLWEGLSDRFHDRNVVAAYSLLAEPMGAADAAQRDAMYDKLVKAIRAKGDDHLLVIHDGFLGVDTFPDPADYGWENVIYSTHMFEPATTVAAYDLLITHYDTLFTTMEERTGVPFFLGSFSTRRDEAWAYESLGNMVQWLEGRGWSWSLWTLKRVDDPIVARFGGPAKTAWGLFGGTGGPDFLPVDLCRADDATIEAAFAAYADLPLEPNLETLARLRPDAPALAD